MIAGLTQEQFRHLPTVSLHYDCDKCGQKRVSCSLMRDISDYSVVDEKITTKEKYTALYLCSGCHWNMTCEYKRFDKYEEEQAE